MYVSGRVKDLFHSPLNEDGDLNRKKEQYIIQKLCELCCIVLNASALVGEPNAMFHCTGIMYLATKSVSFELRSVQS